MEKSPQPRSAEPFGSELKAELLTAEAPLAKGGNEGIIPCALCLLTPDFLLHALCPMPHFYLKERLENVRHDP